MLQIVLFNKAKHKHLSDRKTEGVEDA